MIKRFSVHYREALAAAEREARSLKMIAHGVAARVLAELGVDLEQAAVTTTHVRYP